MPAMLDDPDSPTIYRVSGATPFPEPGSSDLPSEIVPRQVTLRDGRTAATMMPFASRDQVPKSLLGYLADQLNKEIEGGDTYPMTEPMTHEKFAPYWFQNFGALMLLGNIEQPSDLADLPEAATGNWSKTCLGSFYIKPNYPGRSSHVCNAGFLVTDASRGRGVGRLMGECYLDWAPKLGYTYSVFNLVYETNVASCKIWDALGFKRIGRVKGCGDLRSYPGQLVDAIIYGRDLVPGEFPEDLAGVERFDKIKFYLNTARNRAAPADAVSPVSPAAPSAPPPSLSAAPPSAPDELAAIADPAVAAYRYPSPDGGVHPSQTLRDPSVSPLPPPHGHNPMLQDSPRHHDAHVYQPIDPRIIASPHHHGHHHHHHHHEHEHDHDHETDPYAYQTETDFQALLNATAGEDERHAEADDAAARREAEAVDRDLDMLIEQGDEDETMSGVGRGEDDDVQGPVTLDVAAEEAKVKAIYALSYADG
ncbi:hypothetical protein BN1708_000347 [Verticillium longisporum]|uniref:N-acetyltransferase domain-containing protein n=1 Tax=Verticillium longisporum TaxID=100787 RepID=A0A0G4KCN3_VERLO|nr:hypothetical protein BN1708_000347 [Verticillium longisporum]